MFKKGSAHTPPSDCASGREYGDAPVFRKGPPPAIVRAEADEELLGEPARKSGANSRPNPTAGAHESRPNQSS